MLELNKNPDYTWLDTGKIDSEYYDLNADLRDVEVWNKSASASSEVLNKVIDIIKPRLVVFVSVSAGNGHRYGAARALI